MAWSVLQSKSAANAGSGNVAVTFTTANLTAGTKIIAWIEVSCSTNFTTVVSAVKDGALNSWTQLAQKDNGAHTSIFLFALDTPAGDAGTKPTITATVGTNFGAAILVQEVSGLLAGNTSAMLDGTPGVANGTTSPATTGALTTAIANEFLTVAYGDPGDTITVTTPGGWTADATNVGPSSQQDLSVYTKNSTGAAESASITLSGTAADGWNTILAAFKLAAAAGGPVALPAQPGKTWARRFHHRQELQTPPPGAVIIDSTGSSPAGAAAVAAVVTEAVIASPAGAGSVTGSVTQAVTASLAGAGAVTAKATVIAPAAIAGAATVTANVTQIQGAAAAGAGSVTDVVTQAVIASPAGAAAVNATASVTGPATASLAGAGAVTDVATQIVIAAPAGAGTVTAAVTQKTSATLAGAATVTDVATQIVIASPAGAATVTANASVIGAGITASLAAAAAVSAKAVQAVIAAPAAAGSLTASAVQIATATLTAAGNVNANGGLQVPFTVGTLTAGDVSSSRLTAAAASATLTAAGATTATLTATNARTGGPGG